MNEDAHTNMTIVRFLACVYAASLSSCATQSVSERFAAEHDYLTNQFRVAYTAYSSGDYQLSDSLLRLYTKTDSGGYHYQAYAFWAQSLHHLGRDSDASASLKHALKDLEAYRAINPRELKIQDEIAQVREWMRVFPNLPEYLTPVGGFVPYDELPKPLKAPAPPYPAVLLAQGESGMVWLGVNIDTVGNVTEAWVLASDNKAFSDAAMSTVFSYKFTPYRRKGQVARSSASIPFRFKIP